MMSKKKRDWVELIRISFKNTKVGDTMNEDNGPQMMIVGDMNNLQLNEGERMNGF